MDRIPDRAANGWGWRSLAWAQTHPALFYGLVAGLFCSPILFGYVFLPISYLTLNPLWYDPSVVPRNYDLFDAIIYFSPIDIFLKKELANGVFPLWNPYNFAGHPLPFNGQSGMFYPLRLGLLWLFPVALANGLLLWFHLAVAGACAFFLARRMQLQELPALFMGLCWMFNGFLMGWLELGFIAASACWTPLLVLAALRSLRDWAAVPAMALALALLIVSAHLQFALYFVVFGVAVGTVLSWSDWSRGGLLRFGVGTALGLALAAPYLVPSALLMSASQRPAMSQQFWLSTYRQFLASAPGTLFLPDLHGNPRDLFAWNRLHGFGNFIYAETVLYISVVALLFAVAAAGHRRGRFYLGAAVATLLLPATPLYLAMGYLPGLSRVISVRWVGLVHLFLIVAAAYGLEHWLSSGRYRAVQRAYYLLWALAGVAAWQLSGILSGGWQKALEPGALRLPEPTLYLERDAFLEAVKGGFESCYSWTNPNFVLPILSLLALGAMLRHPARFAPLVLLLASLELVSFAYRYNPVEPAAKLFEPTAVTSFLVQESGPWRVAGLSSIKPNTLLPFGLRDVGGYDSFYPRDSAYFMQALLRRPPDGDHLPAQVLLEGVPPLPLLDHLGVRYAVGVPGAPAPSWPVVAIDGLPIYENPNPLPRVGIYARSERVDGIDARLRRLLDPEFSRREVALVEGDLALDAKARGSARLEEDSVNHLTVRAETDGRALLVLNDAWCWGWTATVNGRSAPIHKVNQMFRGVVLEAGESTVRFVFRPPGWNAGLALFGLSTAVCLLLGFGALRRPSLPVRTAGSS